MRVVSSIEDALAVMVAERYDICGWFLRLCGGFSLSKSGVVGMTCVGLWCLFNTRVCRECDLLGWCAFVLYAGNLS